MAIDSARDLPTGSLGRALEAAGLNGPMTQSGSLFELGVLADDVEALAIRVVHALKSLLAELPFVLIPQRVGACAFHLRPPSG